MLETDNKDKGPEKNGKNDKNGVQPKDPKNLTIDEAFGDGKIPHCFDCRKTIYDRNQLTNWKGKFYCKPCLYKILAQRKGPPE